MAKKKETKKEITTEEVVQVVEQPKVETKVVEKPKKDTWEIKDRTYYLSRNRKPLTATIPSTNIYYFDEEKGYERELKYTSNQRTCFVDEMVGDQRLEHITFMNGFLIVPKNKTVLQKLLSLYHPGKNSQYHEQDNVKIAQDEVADIELEIKALNAAQSMEIDLAEAIMRTEIGSKVSKMTSKEVKRDLLVFAKRNPQLFLDLVNDDNVVLRNFGIRATEMGILKLSPDQRTFSWGSNNRKLMNVPFEEHP